MWVLRMSIVLYQVRTWYVVYTQSQPSPSRCYDSEEYHNIAQAFLLSFTAANFILPEFQAVCSRSQAQPHSKIQPNLSAERVRNFKWVGKMPHTPCKGRPHRFGPRMREVIMPHSRLCYLTETESLKLYTSKYIRTVYFSHSVKT